MPKLGETKICKICGVEKSIGDFHKCKHYFASYCKMCQSEFIRSWREENREAVAEKKRVYFKQLPRDAQWDIHLRQRYGIMNDDYVRMWEEQEGVCKICGEPSMRIRLSVDHCHIRGVVRGLLCERCNSLLGRVKDNPEVLERAAQYLRSWEGSQ